MYKAYLTIDDSPSKITPDFIDFLCSKGIVPVMNFIGECVGLNFDEALYAIKKGAVIGNHSYTHTAFSKLTLDECRDEILRTEEEINRAYSCAGVKREYKLFRFPYGDKGGENAASLQQMLRDEFRFDRLDDTKVSFPWWKANHLDTDVDMLWTFDFVEYQLTWDNGFTLENIVQRVMDKNPPQGGVLLDENTMNIVLIHDHEQTDALMPGYYRRIIDYVMSLGVEFVFPAFLSR